MSNFEPTAVEPAHALVELEKNPAIDQPLQDADGAAPKIFAFIRPAEVGEAWNKRMRLCLHAGDQPVVEVTSVSPRAKCVYVTCRGRLPYRIYPSGYGERPDIWLTVASAQPSASTVT